MKKWIVRIIVICIVALISLAGIFLYKKFTTPQKVHYHAGFVVFANNKQVDFSEAKYMNAKPCRVKGEEMEESDDPVEEQIEKAHLHDYVGDVVHVEMANATWKDLFINLHYSINYPSAIAYLNGKKLANFQNQQIHPYDSIVIFIGKNDISQHLQQAITKEHIQVEEKRSEDCG